MIQMGQLVAPAVPGSGAGPRCRSRLGPLEIVLQHHALHLVRAGSEWDTRGAPGSGAEAVAFLQHLFFDSLTGPQRIKRRGHAPRELQGGAEVTCKATA
jgi:hypothetical protein